MMAFIILMAFLAALGLVFLLIEVIRERWHWLLTTPFVITEATFLYFWAAPLLGQDPYPMLEYLLWASSVSSLASGVFLNWALPPLPTRLTRICHPLALILAYLLIIFLWIPFIIFGVFIGELTNTTSYLNKFLFFCLMTWLGFTLIFVYLYRAGRDLWGAYSPILDFEGIVMCKPINEELVNIARETAAVFERITLGKTKPFDPNIQQWAIEKFVWLSNHQQHFSTQALSLFELIEDCLVDILSCDNAPWDTPIQAFDERLKQLSTVLKEYPKFRTIYLKGRAAGGSANSAASGALGGVRAQRGE